jgi:hypothetical protein
MTFMFALFRFFISIFFRLLIPISSSSPTLGSEIRLSWLQRSWRITTACWKQPRQLFPLLLFRLFMFQLHLLILLGKPFLDQRVNHEALTADLDLFIKVFIVLEFHLFCFSVEVTVLILWFIISVWAFLEYFVAFEDVNDVLAVETWLHY